LIASQSPSVFGARCSDGVLFATEKQMLSPLLTPGANPQIFWLSNQIACATVGDRPDCYGAVAKAREYDRPYFANFGIHLSIQEIVGQTSAFFHSKHSGGLPYGTTLLFGGYNGRPRFTPSSQADSASLAPARTATSGAPSCSGPSGA
jgi:20S proteasome subunit alpha 7